MPVYLYCPSLPNTKKHPLVQALSTNLTTWDKWIGGKRSYHRTYDWMAKQGLKSMNEAAYMKFLDQYTKETGIYEFNVGYRGGGGHSTLLERKADGSLIRIEQQTTSRYSTLGNLLKCLMPVPPMSVRGIMRVDNAMFNPKYAGIVRKATKRSP